MTDIIVWLKEHAASLPDGSPELPFFEQGIAEIERYRAIAYALAAHQAARPPTKQTKPKAKPAAKKAKAKR